MNETIVYKIVYYFMIYLVIVFFIIISNIENTNQIMFKMIDLFILVDYHYNRREYSLFEND